MKSKEDWAAYAKKYPCVKCGYCCTKRPCAFGVWDHKNNRCAFLTEDNLCHQYDKIIKHPDQWMSPAFGAGCSSPMFNTEREKKLCEMNSRNDS